MASVTISRRCNLQFQIFHVSRLSGTESDRFRHGSTGPGLSLSIKRSDRCPGETQFRREMMQAHSERWLARQVDRFTGRSCFSNPMARFAAGRETFIPLRTGFLQHHLRLSNWAWVWKRVDICRSSRTARGISKTRNPMRRVQLESTCTKRAPVV